MLAGAPAAALRADSMAPIRSPLRILAVPLMPRSLAIHWSSGRSLPDRPPLVRGRFAFAAPSLGWTSVVVSLTWCVVLSTYGGR